MAEALNNLLGNDKTFVSDFSIRRIHDTWHVFWKDMAMGQVKALAAAAFKAPTELPAAPAAQSAHRAPRSARRGSQSAQAAPGAHAAPGAQSAQAAPGAPAIRGVVLLHLQDAASLRLRAVNEDRFQGLVRRQRTGKVQLHVLELHTAASHFEAPQTWRP